jgi:hypothetical protein
LFQVCNQIGRIFQANRQPQHGVRDAAPESFLGRQAVVGGGARLGHQAFGATQADVASRAKTPRNALARIRVSVPSQSIFNLLRSKRFQSQLGLPEPQEKGLLDRLFKKIEGCFRAGQSYQTGHEDPTDPYNCCE